MLRPQFFTHRPPSSGIHLLSDPFPERLNRTAPLFTRAEILSSQREYLTLPGACVVNGEAKK